MTIIRKITPPVRLPDIRSFGVFNRTGVCVSVLHDARRRAEKAQKP